MDKILKFSASWCGPCKSLSMILENAELKVDVESVDIDEDTVLSSKYGIRSVPTMIYVRDDVEIGRITGAQTIEYINNWIDTMNF